MVLYLLLHPSTVGQFTPQTAASSQEIHQKSCQGLKGRTGPLSSMFCEEASSVPQCLETHQKNLQVFRLEMCSAHESLDLKYVYMRFLSLPISMGQESVNVLYKHFVGPFL